ncbi:MFS transporter [Auraticoccus monumenti]|uniref:Predicted arabinose efflux permease, MFS family n=1 Tax=Auraticoccus monumenti TaxID=675864 RepID=A0A1G6Y473_9ACTN|nr:MFS transporter [Auraticoccus monumenti]SDD85150.1 Predicted arabinose efflux permease, MFS family [Auraticoccus monumenti]
MALRDLLADTRPLANPHFRRLWTAQIITVIGAQLTVVAVPTQIYAITGSSAYVGLTGVFGLVPLVVFGLYGGALADHFDRRRVLMVTTVGLIVTSALFWVQAAMGLQDVWLLLWLFAVQQAFFAVNSPTRSAILPRLLPAGQLPAANALSTTVFQAGAIAGPLVGGALIPLLGYSWLYLVDTLTLLITLVAVIRLPPMPVVVEAVGSAVARAPGLRSVLEGFAYLRGRPVLLMSFVVDIVAMVFGMPRALFPEIAHLEFGGPQEGGLEFALLFAAIPAGAVLGGIFSGWLSRVERQGRAVLWCIAVWGFGITGFGVCVFLADGSAPVVLVLGLVCLAVAGAADVASSAIRGAILQTAAEDNLRGRLQGVFTVVVVGGPRVADVAHGGVAALAGAAVATTGGGVLVVLGVAVCALAAPTFLRYRVPPR